MTESPKPIGSRLRSFLEQLFTSRHVRFLEAELVRVRLEYQGRLREMGEERAALHAKIRELELAVWPQASQAGRAWAASAAARPRSSTLEVPAGASFLEALEEHKKKEEEIWRQRQSDKSSTNASGVAAAEK